ncbi:MAG: catalase A [Claussenomyces sp. TS43310]|nr:MAG: catalase A [Claussenomyces sp. TS43310]
MLSAMLRLLALSGAVHAACPYMEGNADWQDSVHQAPANHRRDAPHDANPTKKFMTQFELNDTDVYMTSDVGGPIEDQYTLKAGPRGPSLLEDFIYRQKIQHFDHERVPERVVHARGVGAHGTFTSYGNWSNITAASFLGAADKKSPVFVRFSTVAGSRGSADTVRDVHGFATRIYTDEGNFDIVGNNIPVFFIQDAIRFPDLIHAVKPMPDREIPQAATAHDTAWDFFSSQPAALHTVFWAMAGFGIPRSVRHMDGFGIHTYRLVTEDGKSKLVKFHWKSKQGKASLVWEEAQILAGKNSDFHRQDLWDAIASGNGPEWELGVQVMEEEDQEKYGFDLLDPTKIVPEELVPVTILGKMQLNLNPTNYFAETEQVMFQPGHIVRGIDFSEDPLLQGRIYSYLDTQLNRHGGPNFEQLPINRPRIPIHNNNRDGAAQNFIPLNTAAYSPNTLNEGSPKQATRDEGNGFFTTPGRSVSGFLNRALPASFNDVWSQPRLFYNSLLPIEQQFLINAIRFEVSHVQSTVVKQNVLTQLNRISHDIAERVAAALNLPVPAPDPTYYHNNKSSVISIFNHTLPSIATLNVGILASVSSNASLAQAADLKKSLTAAGLVPSIVGESLSGGADITYSSADATAFDGIIVTSGAEALFINGTSTLFPEARPLQILQSGYRWGKPVGSLGSGSLAFQAAAIKSTPGVYISSGTDTASFLDQFKAGLKQFKFVDRFPQD